MIEDAVHLTTKADAKIFPFHLTHKKDENIFRMFFSAFIGYFLKPIKKNASPCEIG